jgi:hypothetical protein
MTVTEKIVKEIAELTPSEQKKVLLFLKQIRKKEIQRLASKSKAKKHELLSLIDEIAIDTGIPDLAEQHDHYLYGVPKK